MVDGDRLPERIVLGRLQGPATACRTVNFLVSDDTGTMPLGDARIVVTGECAGSGLSIRTADNGKGLLCVPTGCPLQVDVSREGYAPHTFMLSAIEEQDNWKVLLRPAAGLTGPAAPIASGTVIVLNNIYYDFNKSEIRKGDAAELITLANVMKQYPDLRIEMTAHTDTRGSAEYNLELSRRRVESARQYLVLLGIGADRIAVSAAGEAQPRNHCLDGVPCTEAEHQYNRRTEVRIINPAQGMEVRYPRNE
jgi:outer membrane protein OmpA-like peptidoglycan-associated protein